MSQDKPELKTGPARYGQYYWCIKTPLSEDGDVYVHADAVEVAPSGALVMRSERYATLVIAQGQWTAVYAASVMDGHAVAVEHWKGEVAIRKT
jgi:hypothetical protein